MAYGDEQELARAISSFSADPLGYAHFAFRWGQGELSESRGPRQWQSDVMGAIASHLRGPSRHQPLQIAVSSGHGIGKSALIGMLMQWGASTFEDTRVVITANTASQLDTKTWPEVAKWFRRAINAHWWDIQATSVSVRERKHKETWRVDAITWSENNTEAFAGLHNKGKRIIVIYDEASAIADKVWEVTEGALTDENTEIIWIAFGNPTQNTGRFRECFGRYKHRWVTRQIDSRTVEGTNKELIAKWVEDNGEDSDFVRVRVRGEFPRAGSAQFIPGDIVAEARQRTVIANENQPKILAVDVARFGDDQTVIGLRQGGKLSVLAKLRGQDTQQVAARVGECIREHKPDGTVVDGDGIGAGVVDALRALGHGGKLYEFHGGATPDDSEMYFNLRAEAWGRMREWLKQGAELPDDPELEADLTGPTYHFSGKNQIQLERKEEMKRRGLSSPDTGDMLAMSFAFKIEIMKSYGERLADTAMSVFERTQSMTATHLAAERFRQQQKPVQFGSRRRR